MLEGVIQQYHIQLLVIGHQLVNAVTAILVDGYRHLRKLLLHLVGLVANLRHGGVGRCLDKSFALTLITSAEYGHMELFLQQSDEILHMRRLTRTANGNVTYRNHRNIEGAALEHADAEQHVAQVDS